MGKPDIIYEDNDIIVCYKPAGIATQTRRIGQQDMESFIRNYRAAKNEPPYVGIVHRQWKMKRHGILSQIISPSTSLPIHLKSQAKKTSWQKKQCFSTG